MAIQNPMAAILWLVAAVILIVVVRRARRQRRRGRVGSAAAGAVSDWLNEDKRGAVPPVPSHQSPQSPLPNPQSPLSAAGARQYDPRMGRTQSATW
jgi:hypothetical protein